MSEGFPKFPEQVEAVYNILQYLLDKDALSKDPASVEMTRVDYSSVFPCRRPKREETKLNISQIIEARESLRNWWFIGPINELKITQFKLDNITKAEKDLLNRIAKNSQITLSMK